MLKRVKVLLYGFGKNITRHVYTPLVWSGEFSVGRLHWDWLVLWCGAFGVCLYNLH
jgi:hypothetical protein